VYLKKKKLPFYFSIVYSLVIVIMLLLRIELIWGVRANDKYNKH
jgi:hypothetical protein